MVLAQGGLKMCCRLSMPCLHNRKLIRRYFKITLKLCCMAQRLIFVILFQCSKISIKFCNKLREFDSLYCNMVSCCLPGELLVLYTVSVGFYNTATQTACFQTSKCYILLACNLTTVKWNIIPGSSYMYHSSRKPISTQSSK